MEQNSQVIKTQVIPRQSSIGGIPPAAHLSATRFQVWAWLSKPYCSPAERAPPFFLQGDTEVQRGAVEGWLTQANSTATRRIALLNHAIHQPDRSAPGTKSLRFGAQQWTCLMGSQVKFLLWVSSMLWGSFFPRGRSSSRVSSPHPELCYCPGADNPCCFFWNSQRHRSYRCMPPSLRLRPRDEALESEIESLA